MYVNFDKIKVRDDRFRREFSEEKQASLIESLQRPMGLMNAITVKELPDGNYEVIAGERRFRSIKLIYELDETFNYGGKPVPSGKVPVLISSELDLISRLKAELDENLERQDFHYLEEAEAKTKIAELEQKLLEKEKPKEVKPAKGLMDISPEAMKKAAERITSGKSGGSYTKQVRDSIEMTAAVEENPELAKKLKKAKSFNEGQKILKKAKKEQLHERLAAIQGNTFSADEHKIYEGDCLEIMPTLPKASFDVCITDPIYGIDANKFGDAAGRASSYSHNYEDSYETWKALLPPALKLMSILMKPDAHIYIACDFHRYLELKGFIEAAGTKINPWRVPNYPIIQYKKGGGRVPVPGYTFRRSYEVWLYAYRGNKQENAMLNDVIETVSGGTETHGAGKPVALLKTFLSRSTMPGDNCLDFMAGSGSIIPACHENKVKCTAIELDKIYYGRCLERVKELKAL